MADPDPFSLEGKTALVTGASRGIGRAIALAFAEAGAKVALLARSRFDLDTVVAEIGGDALAVACDVTEPEQIDAAVAEVRERLGPVDVLVNNAGGPVFNAPFIDIRSEGWLRVFELNVFSVVALCRSVGAEMIERGTGSVINVDSIGASHPSALVAPYCAAKAAVVNLTSVLAQEWGMRGVRVNALSPGLIETDINRALTEHPELGTELASRVPLGRWGQPSDLVGAALWLASDASAYVTGAHIPVDGGIGVVAPQGFRPG